MIRNENLIAVVETKEWSYEAKEVVTFDGFNKSKEWFMEKTLAKWNPETSRTDYILYEKRQYKSRNALMQKMNKIKKA